MRGNLYLIYLAQTKYFVGLDALSRVDIMKLEKNYSNSISNILRITLFIMASKYMAADMEPR